MSSGFIRHNIFLYSFICCLCLSTVLAGNDTDFSSITSAKCIFDSSKNLITCNSSSGNESCEAQVLEIPFNFTLYAIGELKATAGPNPITWFRLYPRRLDDNGWWYYKNIEQEDMKLSIHSKEKITTNDSGFTVIDSLCWSRMSLVIRSSKMQDTIIALKYNNELSFNKVKMIGTLEVV